MQRLIFGGGKPMKTEITLDGYVMQGLIFGGGKLRGLAADEDAGGDGRREVVARGFEGGKGEGRVDGDAGAYAFDEGGWREDEEGVAVVFDQAMEAVPVRVGDAL